MRVPALLAAAALAIAPAAVARQTDYAAAGRFKVVITEEGPDCTLFRPLTFEGRNAPVILWGNGTRSRIPAYTPMLSQWASHGFVVAAANTNSAGSGAPLLACLDWLSASAYASHLDLTRIGASGHSQGGGGAIMAARDRRIITTAPIQAYTRGLGYVKGAEAAQRGSMLLLTGGADTTAGGQTDQKPVFDATNVPVVWATLKDLPHTAPASGDSGLYRVATTAWFRWKLMGDAAAGRWFEGADCGLCRAREWTVLRRGG